jgi:AcrR family transcriptional regulator
MSNAVEPQSTRDRILEATLATVQKLGLRASMSRIAQAAGVSRQALYLKFGDRTGLLYSLIRNSTSADPDAVAMRAAVELPPLEAFEGFFRSWIRTAIKLESALRSFWREAEGDPELMRAVRQADKDFYDRYQQVFGKLDAARLLQPIWSAAEAADAAYATTMYGVFVGHLRNMRGWPPQKIEALAMKILRTTFLTPAAARRAARIAPPGAS